MAETVDVEFRTLIKHGGATIVDDSNEFPTADGDIEEHFQVPASTTRTINVNIDKTKIKAVIVKSDKTFNLTTNTGPDETIPVTGGKPYYAPGANLLADFGHNLTTINFVNGAGAVANIDFYMFMDNLP